MTNINDIELIIRELIETNEKIVSKYDSKLLCSDYDHTRKELKELTDRKEEIVKNLEKSMDDFFKVKSNFLSRRLGLNSFKLVSTVISFEYKFNLPHGVSKSSNQYFCYVNLMDKLVREYDSISRQKDDYFILDITSHLKLDELIKEV